MQTKNHETNSSHTLVIGGGLAGLIAAVKLARAGRSVMLLEQAKNLGGRAATNEFDDVRFNLGPRALYCHGHAFRLLREMEFPFSGSFPNPGKALGVYQGREIRLPRGLSDLLLTRLLSLREKWQLFQFFRNVAKIETSGLQQTSVQSWVNERYGNGPLANFLFTLFRLTSYSADMEHYSIGAALDQFKIGLGNVWYLDHGWQSLIDGLRNVAVNLGVDVRPGMHAAAISSDGNRVTVRTANGATLNATSAVLAVNPQQACTLLDLPVEHRLSQWASAALPIRSACLDIALTSLPRPQHRFALGIDQPYYFSVHSAAAQLAPPGVAVIHVLKYLSATDEPGKHHERELEGFLDQVQPGWRQRVRARRYLPSMLVAPDVPQAAVGGLTGRPRVDAAEIPGVFLAGDWVGGRGQLADASAASAEEAAERVLQLEVGHRAPDLQYA
jgi:phytoene dehydrogenase-like protein